MTFFEFVAGIVEVALAQVDHPEAVTTIEIEHASHYSKESHAWEVVINRERPKPLPYSERFIDRMTRERKGLTCDLLPLQPEQYVTVLYGDGEFVLDDL